MKVSRWPPDNALLCFICVAIEQVISDQAEK